MANPYETLGVAKAASQKDIQSAYRKLAKKLHPDLNPGDKAAEEKFKAVSAAYAIVGDEDKRKRFDNGEIDETGAEPPPRSYYRDYAAEHGGRARYQNDGGFADFGDADEIFASIFGRTGGRQGGATRGENLHFTLEVPFREAAAGGSRTVKLPDGPTLDIQIPSGVRDGQVLRLRGKGSPGYEGGPAGDALIEIRLLLDKQFVRDGDDVRIEVPISIREAVLGGKIEIPTLSGAVALSIPANSSSGKPFDLKARDFQIDKAAMGTSL